MRTRRSTTRPSPTTTRPSGSTPRTPRRTTTAATPGSDKKEYDKAIADYNEAIRLDPKDPWLYFNRAVTSLITSRDNAADCRTSLELWGWRAANAPYAVLIGYFGHRKSGREDEARRLLDEGSEKYDSAAWPYPVLRYLRHEIEAKALLTAATDVDKMTEASTYLGLDLELGGRTSDAVEQLQWVKDHGKASFVEYDIAVAELDRPRVGHPARMNED